MTTDDALNDEGAQDEPRVSIKIHGGPWVASPIRIIADRRLSPTARLVFQILLANANSETGQCFPGFERIAVYVGLDNARSLYRPMKELETAGYITRERRPGRGGFRASDDYELFPDNPTAPAIADLNAEAKRRQETAKVRQAETRSRNRALGPSARSSDGQARDRVTTKRAKSRAELHEKELPESELENARAPQVPEPSPSVPLEPAARVFPSEDSEAATLFESAGSTANAVGVPTPTPEAKPKGKRAAAAGANDPDFVRFWAMSLSWAPHHDTRKAAYEAWVKTRRSGVTGGALLAAFEQAVGVWATWPADHHEYIPAERNWLGRDLWKKPVKSRSANVRPAPGGGRNEATGQRASELYAQVRAERYGDQPAARAGALPVREVVESTSTPHRRPA